MSTENYIIQMQILLDFEETAAVCQCETHTTSSTAQTWLPWVFPTNMFPLGMPYKHVSLGDALQTWLPWGSPTNMGPLGMPYKLGSLGDALHGSIWDALQTWLPWGCPIADQRKPQFPLY